MSSRQQSSDDDEDYSGQGDPEPRKKSVYESRVEQILYEHPELQIEITDAGKSQESGGNFIVYTIRTGVCAPQTTFEAAVSFLSEDCLSDLLIFIIGFGRSATLF